MRSPDVGAFDGELIRELAEERAEDDAWHMANPKRRRPRGTAAMAAVAPARADTRQISMFGAEK